VGNGVEAELVVACLGRGGGPLDLGDGYDDDEDGDEDGGEAGPG
jgi:hypothetical protein